MPHHHARELLLKLCLGMVVVMIVYLPLSFGSQAVHRELAQETLIAFLSVIGAAWAGIGMRRTCSPLNALLFSVFSFQAVVHFLQDAQILLWPESLLDMGSAAYMLAASTDVQLTFVLLCVGVLLRSRTMSFRSTVLLALAAGSAAALAHSLTVAFAVECLDDFGLNAASLLLGVISLSLMFLLSMSLLRSSESLDDIDRYWMIAGLVLLGAASTVMIHDVGASSSLYGLSFRAGSLLTMALAVAVKTQTADGIGLLDSHLAPVLTSAMAIFPYAVILAVEATTPVADLPNLGAYQLVHIIMAGLCLIMAFLLYRYVQRMPVLILYPVAGLFAFWGIAHAVTAVVSIGPVAAALGESRYPYIMGGMVSISVIVRAGYWAHKQTVSRVVAQPKRWVLTRPGVFAALLFLGVAAEQMLVPVDVSGAFDAPARVALLTTSLIATGGAVPLSYLIVRQKRTWRSLEGFSSSFIAVLLIPLILKSVFPDFSPGWWSAELVGLFALLLMPAIVGLLYIDALSSARQSERHANLYSDLLMHDISNMHQAALISLSLCEVDGVPEASRSVALDDARRSLTRAMEIVSNVRSISSAKAGNGDPLAPVDLVRAIDTAHQHMLLQMPVEKIDFALSAPESECLVVADDLLPNLFYNLMINAARYSPDSPTIRVEILIGQLRGRRCWETRITDHGRGIEPARKAKLFERFMDGADGVGLGLAVAYALVQRYSGEITVYDRVEGDYTKGTIFAVSLPASFQSSPLVKAAMGSTQQETIEHT